MILLLSTAGTACCVGGIIGSWRLFQAVSGSVYRISARLDAGLQGDTSAMENVRRAVG
jgi:hypothetical protein